MHQRTLIIIGLGNPGPKYKNTYHNVGHMFVDFLADPKKYFRKEKLFLYQDCEKYLLVKTAVFMNESGTAVKTALRRFASTSDTTFVIVHDDADILIGNHKLSSGRSAAGHKGVESVIRVLGHANFMRLRIGIRPGAAHKRGLETQMDADIVSVNQRRNLHQSASREKAGDFVLRNIAKNDRETLYSVFGELKRSVIEKVT